MVRFFWIPVLTVVVSAWWFTADAQPYFPLPSTSDISVGTTATVDVAIPGGTANFIYLKNNCSTDLHFDLRGARDANQSPLNLGQDQSFTGELRLGGRIVASADSAATAACTFTVQFAK